VKKKKHKQNADRHGNRLFWFIFLNIRLFITIYDNYRAFEILEFIYSTAKYGVSLREVSRISASWTQEITEFASL